VKLSLGHAQEQYSDRGRSTILIVDDNRDSTEMLATLVKFSRHETHTAHDGMAAVAAASKLELDVILLDYRSAPPQRL